jgi:long-chain acyl-CoA synthetase
MTYASIIDIFEERVESSADRVALRFREEDRTVSWTWKDWRDEIWKLVAHLHEMGVESGDRVVILSSNRPEWVVVDLAIMYIGAVSVPIYPATLARHCRWTLRHADADWMVIEDPLQLEKLIEVPDELDSLRGCLMMDRVTHLESPDRRGRVEIRYDKLKVPEKLVEKISWYQDVKTREPVEPTEARASIQGEDLASIVYTSGTTGAPRGAMLTHANFVAEVLGNAEVMPIEDSDRQILLLPLSQIFARILYMTSAYLGAETSFSAGFSYLMTEFQREKPTFFVGVPSVFERLGARFAVDSSTSRLFGTRRLKRFARTAIYRSKELQGKGDMGLLDRVIFEVGDRTLFRRLRQVFGGRLRFAISGGAPLSKSICEIFHGAGIPIIEGYGLTESCGAATVNSPEDFVSGTVGQPLPGVKVRIDGNGEILLRGDSIATGYWNDEKATKKNFRDGWLHTGDLGQFVDHKGNVLDIYDYEDGAHLQVLERLDDTIVLKDGTKISPQRVESVLQSIPIIRTAVVTSSDDVSISALVTLESHILRRWAHEKGRGKERFEELCVDPEIYEWVKSEIDSANSVLRPSENVKNFAILPVSFSPASGELTHTFKVRRRFVIDKYRSVLDRLDARNGKG